MPAGIVLLFTRFKAIEKFSRQMRQLYAYVATESTLIAHIPFQDL